MASEKSAASEKYAIKIDRGPEQEFIAAPKFGADFQCVGPDGGGGTKEVWRDHWDNIVVDQGRAILLNKVFATGFTDHTCAFLFLHSASIGSGNTWGNISASQVGGYNANLPRVTFATAGTASNAGTNVITANTSYQFSASTYTVSGAGIMFYTNTSCATNFGTSDGRMYCYGSFSGGSQTVQNGNTLNVTVSVSLNSA